jgi:hypothetical protein
MTLRLTMNDEDLGQPSFVFNNVGTDFQSRPSILRIRSPAGIVVRNQIHGNLLAD